MNLEDFSLKNLGKDLLESKGLVNFLNNFINELKEYLEKDKEQNMINLNVENKYSNYWQYQNFMEDNVAATIGLSRWGADITYYDELGETVDNSILELSEKEGTLYRTHTTMPRNAIPNELENEDLIFQYKDDGTVNVRSDLKKQVVDLASKKASKLKEEENNRNNEYKKEGHIYEALEDDGYIFLNDLAIPAM